MTEASQCMTWLNLNDLYNNVRNESVLSQMIVAVKAATSLRVLLYNLTLTFPPMCPNASHNAMWRLSIDILYILALGNFSSYHVPQLCQIE